MKNLLCTSALLALLSGAGGCTLYFGGGDDGDDCVYEGAADEALAVGYRNPDTGVCEDWWGGGGGGCGYYGDDADAEAADPAPLPDWAMCWGYCEGLDEASCLGTSGCRVAYSGEAFYGCWGTAPTGPIQGGGCEGLDAYSCSLHDDCTAHYTGGLTDDGVWEETRFSFCANEPWAVGCYSDLECPGGYTCNAEEVCGSPPGCGGEDGGACPDVCYGTCVPAGGGCEAVDCGMGSHCELECYDPCDSDSPEPMGGGCAPVCNPACIPDTWLCEGVDCGAGNHCEEVCTDSIPGSCWSSCVPDAPTPTCEELTDETACDARAECTPVYTGYGCTCDPDGSCDCVSWEFARCESAVMPF